jgi:hypothetical protein
MSKDLSKIETYLIENCLNKIKAQFPKIDEATNYLDALRSSLLFNGNHKKTQSPTDLCTACTIANPHVLFEFGICLDRDMVKDFAFITGYKLSKGEIKKKINADDYRDKFERPISTGKNGRILVTFAEAQLLLKHQVNIDIEDIIKKIYNN